ARDWGSDVCASDPPASTPTTPVRRAPATPPASPPPPYPPGDGQGGGQNSPARPGEKVSYQVHGRGIPGPPDAVPRPGRDQGAGWATSLARPPLLLLPGPEPGLVELIQLWGQLWLGQVLQIPHERLVAGHPAAAPQAAGQVGAEELLLGGRSEEHTSELQSRENLVCRLLLEKKK